VLAGIAMLALASCASAPRRAESGAALASRATALAQSPTWSFEGRVAVSDGEDGGSGRIRWRQDGEDFVVEIRAPVSQRTWRLTQTGDELVLEGAREEPVRGYDAEALLARQVGWRLPFAEMRHWVRANAASREARVVLDEDRRPRTIEEGGWRVEYRKYDESQAPPLPQRIVATRAPYEVRLAIARWQP
jgi:outer membrane lipoprotein LolB